MLSSQFSTPCGPFSLSQLAKVSGASIYKEKGASFIVANLATLSEADSSSLSMLHQKKYLKTLSKSLAGVCIIAPEYVNYAPENMYLLVHNNPYKAYALISQVFYPEKPFTSFIAPSAYIAQTAKVGKDCFIAHGAYIGENVRIGDRCKIGVNTFIGDDVVMGDDCHIVNSSSISNTKMGNKVIVHPGARIGQDGFGFASDAQGHYKIPHRGGVIIGNDVEIGANTCIDRGSLDNTVIEDCCRLDNLIQIGHNVKVGKGSIIVAQAGIAGSSQLGEFVTIAGQVGVIGHLNIGEKATILAGSRVYKDVKSNARIIGFPAVPWRDWQKQSYCINKLIKNRNYPTSSK